MIANAKPAPREHNVRSSDERFLEMLPAIERQARHAFRHLDPEARAEMVEEVVANAYVAYSRLVELGKPELAYPTPLASNGIKQARAGRKVGGKLNVRDVSSRHCQLTKGVKVDRLDHFDEESQEWREILIEDHTAGPAETACCRIDFADWLKSLSRRYRRIATTLATGETTKRVARRFRVSPGRVSQIRRELFDAWNRFQGEAEAPAAVA
jgi:hypothetical protein